MSVGISLLLLNTRQDTLLICRLCISHPGVRESLCPDGTWSAPTASIFNDVYTILSAIVHNTACYIVEDLKELVAEHQPAIQSLNLQSVVMLGHSFGGTVIADMTLGEYVCCHHTWSTIYPRYIVTAEAYMTFPGDLQASAPNLQQHIVQSTAMCLMLMAQTLSKVA